MINTIQSLTEERDTCLKHWKEVQAVNDGLLEENKTIKRQHEALKKLYEQAAGDYSTLKEHVTSHTQVLQQNRIEVIESLNNLRKQKDARIKRLQQKVIDLEAQLAQTKEQRPSTADDTIDTMVNRACVEASMVKETEMQSIINKLERQLSEFVDKGISGTECEKCVQTASEIDMLKSGSDGVFGASPCETCDKNSAMVEDFTKLLQERDDTITELEKHKASCEKTLESNGHDYAVGNECRNHNEEETKVKKVVSFEGGDAHRVNESKTVDAATRIVPDVSVVQEDNVGTYVKCRRGLFNNRAETSKIVVERESCNESIEELQRLAKLQEVPRSLFGRILGESSKAIVKCRQCESKEVIIADLEVELSIAKKKKIVYERKPKKESIDDLLTLAKKQENENEIWEFHTSPIFQIFSGIFVGLLYASQTSEEWKDYHLPGEVYGLFDNAGLDKIYEMF
eukprot:CFRG1523T1